MYDFLNREFFGNSVKSYLTVFILILLAWILLKLIRSRMIHFLRLITRKTETYYDDVIIHAFDKFLLPLIYLLFNYQVITGLNWNDRLQRIFQVAMMVAGAYFLVRAINYLIHGIVSAFMTDRGEPDVRVRQLNGILLVLKVVIWLGAIIMLVDNLGYDVTTIIAGLGVGGIAIALAAQNILGDLFSYLVIFFDKPFEIGDFIITNDASGVVEKIGIKTSHVRSLDGQQLVVPNSEIVKKVIQNFKRLERRRVVFTIGVVYYSSATQLKKIPEIIRQVVEKETSATFDRAHLKSFGDFSINYEIVYYIESPDYLIYMDTHQSVCLQLFERFEEERIEFAFPTQTLFVGSDKIPVNGLSSAS